MKNTQPMYINYSKLYTLIKKFNRKYGDYETIIFDDKNNKIIFENDEIRKSVRCKNIPWYAELSNHFLRYMKQYKNIPVYVRQGVVIFYECDKCSSGYNATIDFRLSLTNRPTEIILK